MRARAARRQKRIPFDATAILKEFGKRELGSCKMGSLHLSRMSRRANEYYIPEHVVTFDNLSQQLHGRDSGSTASSSAKQQDATPVPPCDSLEYHDEPACG